MWPIRPDVYDQMFTSADQQSSVVEPFDEEQIGTSEEAQQDDISGTPKADNADASITTLPEDVIPVPIITYKAKKKKCSDRQGKTAVVTSSPYVKELSSQQENRELKKQLKALQREIKVLRKNVNKPGTMGKKNKSEYGPVVNCNIAKKRLSLKKKHMIKKE